jgi:hypothetical protein
MDRIFGRGRDPGAAGGHSPTYDAAEAV